MQMRKFPWAQHIGPLLGSASGIQCYQALVMEEQVEEWQREVDMTDAYRQTGAEISRPLLGQALSKPPAFSPPRCRQCEYLHGIKSSGVRTGRRWDSFLPHTTTHASRFCVRTVSSSAQGPRSAPWPRAMV